jgi:hypothetical protein
VRTLQSGTIAVIGPLADAKENMAGTYVATNMDKSISANCRNKSGGEWD